jgi:hypothetical protein
MEFEKFKIEDQKFSINLKFYFWLKHLVKTNLTDTQSRDLLARLISQNDYEQVVINLDTFLNGFKGKTKSSAFIHLISNIMDMRDVEIFLFSLQLYIIKDLLLAESKLKNILAIHSQKLDLLSIAYDEESLYSPYATRVNGALLALLFFEKLESGKMNFMSQDAQQYLSLLSKSYLKLKDMGLEANQIFMLMFSESINQSIISDSGSNYEDRIMNVLLSIGIHKDSITKTHDKNDKSTEFDLFFELEGKTYGIGAKRTLRERYKQFIKTALSSKIDVMIEITLGLDLNYEKAKTILAHGVKIFVADEIYNSRNFMQTLDGIFSVKDLTLQTLKKL